MLQLDNLYRLKRGNQDQTVGLIIKGATASVQVLGSQVRPTTLSDLEDCAGEALTNGTWTFSMLPAYVYFTGVADAVEIVKMSYEDLNTTLL